MGIVGKLIAIPFHWYIYKPDPLTHCDAVRAFLFFNRVLFGKRPKTQNIALLRYIFAHYIVDGALSFHLSY